LAKDTASALLEKAALVSRTIARRSTRSYGSSIPNGAPAIAFPHPKFPDRRRAWPGRIIVADGSRAYARIADRFQDIAEMGAEKTRIAQQRRTLTVRYATSRRPLKLR
jgi:hypothetical protein